MASRPPKFVASSWEFTQKMIRIGHNRRVKQYFKDVGSDTSTANGRAAIKTSLLIRDADSAIETLNKMVYFASYLDQDKYNSYPDDWQIKKGQDIPQLAIIYRPADKKNESGNYTIHLPHFNGNRNFKAPAYFKGNYRAKWVLKDNSHIIVNAKTSAEALRVIRQLEKYVDRKYQTKETPWLTVAPMGNTTYKQIKVNPHRADYYPHGKEGNIAQWRIYL